MENRNWCWVSDKKKEKWKNKFFHKNNTFLLVLPLFFATQFVSAKTGDGVNVTQSDFQALKAFKHELFDLKGILRSWNDSGYGVCSGGWVGIKCDKGQVIAIQLPWKGLGGRISEKINQLQELRKLSLHDNVLGGPVPMSLGVLRNLRGVYLFNNRFSGSIPLSIGHCPFIRTLDFSNNQLSGTIPSNLANSTKMYRLNLSFNSISGSIPVSLTESSSLTFLALQHNNLSGYVPNTWGSITGNNSHKLQSLTLDHNLLSGKIPISLSKLGGTLEEIKLSHNQIDGTIPSELGHLSRLKMLDLSNNSINGEIPNSLSKLPNLTYLDVSYNNLSGIVPSLLLNKFNSSSFVGNLQLCGYSISTPCPSPPPQLFPSPSHEASKHGHRGLSTKTIILIASAALLVVVLFLCFILLCCLIKEKGKTGGHAATGRGAKPVLPVGAEVESGGEASGKLVHFDGPFVFTADDLLCATAEIMGKSAYGTAYKATLDDGNEVAVKRLREKIAKSQKEFETEVVALGQIRHPNVLALRAYYLGPKGEKLLVFDYMPNGSLASFLHARGPETAIPWPTRMNIVMGVTRGLCYLHTQENIIHGNLTSSNIMLDEHNIPTIADVGLSCLMISAANTNVVATAGTQGYCAPELSDLKNANVKTDIYSLGVILLELLTGKPPREGTDALDLPQWVASIVKEEWTNEVFDVELMKDASNEGDELLNTLNLALHCVDPSPTARPETQEVLQKLEEIRSELVASSADDGAGVPSKSE